MAGSAVPPLTTWCTSSTWRREIEGCAASAAMDRPCRMGLPLLDQILVMGQMQLTTQLIRACLRRGIPIASPWCSTAPTNSSRPRCQGRPLRPLVAVISL